MGYELVEKQTYGHHMYGASWLEVPCVAVTKQGFCVNKKALKTLSGLLQTSAEKTLLNQITGPTAQGGGSSPTPPPPTP